MNEDRWFHDSVTPDMAQLHGIRGRVYSGQTAFQSVEVLDLGSYGRSLVLDGKIQSSEYDEFIYHEALVHSPMVTHPHPRTCFIAGGGEGATLREVLKHPSVERVVMVDIDKEVIDISRRYLPSFHRGSFDDARLELHHVDARGYLEECRQRFDVVILDLTEPMEEGPASVLHTREFYSLVGERLSPGGVCSLQAGSSAWCNHQCFTTTVNTLKAAFPCVFPYEAYVPSYGGTWGFAVASAGVSPLDLSPQEVDHRLSSRKISGLRFYDGLTHQGMFSLPRHLRQAIAEEVRVSTIDRPFTIT